MAEDSRTPLGAVMKSLTTFLQVLTHEMGERCHTSTIRDCKTIAERYEHEGLSFVTITLPTFGKDFEKSLDQGFVDRNQFNGFRWTGGLPSFLGGFLDLVFDRGTGRLLDNPSIDAILSVRQITLMLGKTNLPCSDARTKATMGGFVKCEQELRTSDMDFHGEIRERFIRVARLLWADVLTDIDLSVFNGDVIPKHGSGNTADRIRGNAKYNQRTWTTRLENYFPAGEMIFSSWHHSFDATVKYLEPGSEIPVRVITVPKTLKTPRIIALEPTCMQYMQQGILRLMKVGFREFDNPRNLICSDSQLFNREMARQGSITGALATLDMSEASDRVSNQHVRALLADHPHLFEAVDATRSRKAEVPGHGVLRLAKFASMGSALCFPLEAMVFCTIIFCGIEQKLNRRLNQRDIKSLWGQVRVYGDDIIIPVEFVGTVVEELTSFGMRVNSSKSFWTGKFRESCGGDYYDGSDVSVVRIKEVFPRQLSHVAEIVSTVSLRNRLFERGFSESVDWLDNLLTKILPVFPVVEPGSQGIGRWSWEPIVPSGFHPDLHIPLVKACVAIPVIPKSFLEGDGALVKWFLMRGEHPFEDKDHLLRAGRSVSVDIETRWVSPFSRGESA